MDTHDYILSTLGEIKGELIQIRKLSERVARLEQWQAWLKGGWAALTGGYLYLCRFVVRP